MLDKISWGDFFTYAAGAMTVYYSAIGLLFYRRELRGLLSGKTTSLIFKRTAQQEKSVAQQPAAIQTDDHYQPESHQLEKVLTELRYDVIPKAGEQPTKAKLAVVFQQYLETLTGNYPAPFRSSIIQLMVKEAAEQCGIAFQEEELQQLW